jgi:hypothetical protein
MNFKENFKEEIRLLNLQEKMNKNNNIYNIKQEKVRNLNELEIN